MLERLVRLCEKARSMNHEEMLKTIFSLAEELSEAVSRNEAMSAQSTEMALQYGQMKAELEGAKRKIGLQEKTIKKLSDQLGIARNGLFGRSTEKLSDVFESALDGEGAEDPVDENAPDPDAGSAGASGHADIPSGDREEAAEEDKKKEKEEKKGKEGKEGKEGKGRAEEGTGKDGGDPGIDPEDILGKKGGRSRHGTKKPGKRQKDLEGIPVRTEYDIDVDELDRVYGAGNWRIYGWSSSKCYVKVKCPVFVKETCRPILSVGLDHHMVRIPNGNPLYRGSMASPSIVASIMYDKMGMALPLNRQSANLAADGVSISRQTMTDWLINIGFGTLGPVYDRLAEYVRSVSHNQCDETYFQVIDDGRKAGSVSYMWLHATSELLSCPPAVVFCYEKTRGTDHLRTFYGKAFKGAITSDGYCSYPVFSEESGGDVVVSGCFMHCRRYFSNALLILNISDMTLEQARALPELKALILIRDIYLADEPLKKLSAEERLAGRLGSVRPKAEAFFEYIESLDEDSPLYSEKLRQAIKYAKNQKQKLLRFIEDPSIPIDNGYAERCIRALCLVRRSSLFSYSLDGAHAFAIIMSLVETARVNGANPYYYLKYLLEIMPAFIQDNAIPEDERLFPWSGAYRDYEANEKKTAFDIFVGEPAVAPKTPRKKDRKKKSA